MPLYSGIFTLSQASLAAKNGTWTGIAPPVVEYLLVAGGGGGGNGGGGGGGGGGAGGLVQGYIGAPTATLTVNVGNGGTGSSGGSQGVSGGNSSLVLSGTTLVSATGGGGGGSYTTTAGASGGSGGGGGNNSTAGGGTTGQGNSGGTSTASYGGGGGGAGTVGLAGTTISANGGAGISSDITGTRTAYAGGGGGSAPSCGTSRGIGGVGGGGNGQFRDSTSGSAGQTNTGGGGGAYCGGTPDSAGYNGGSGIVVVRYPDYYSAPVSTTGSPTAATIGPASISLNGTNQSLTVASNSAFAYGTGDFTWEAWIYPTSASWTTGNFYIFDHGSNGGVLQYYQNILRYYNTTTGGGSLYTTAAATVSSMAWTHVAVSRASGTTRLFINGALLTSAADSHNYAAQAVTVGSYGGGTTYFAGYITNVRLVKGTAVYTAAFTPSAAPLTAVTGTSLLLNANHWAPFTDTSSNGFSITANNSPTVFNSSPFNWVGSGAGYRVYSWTSSGTVTF